MDPIALAIAAAAVLYGATGQTTGMTRPPVCRKCAQCGMRRRVMRRRVMRRLKPGKRASWTFAVRQRSPGSAVSGCTVAAQEPANAGPHSVWDAYGALKDMLARKLGVGSKISEVISDLESVPNSDGYRMALSRQIRKARADQDPELLMAAQVLLMLLYASMPGAQVVRQIADRFNTRAAAGSAVSAPIHSTTPIDGNESKHSP